MPVPGPDKSLKGQVLFLDTGIDFNVPQKDTYGLDFVGMFGVLPHYLNDQGYRCTNTSEITAQLLSQSDVLVVFNPMKRLNKAELTAIWQFVEGGGNVLAVGDHTGDEQVRLPLNDILEPVGIELNFDSAIPFKNLWADDFELRRSPIFSGVSDRQVQLVVGASLEA